MPIDIEKILEKFENELNSFETTEEKVEYLKQFGFVVENEPNEEEEEEETK